MDDRNLATDRFHLLRISDSLQSAPPITTLADERIEIFQRILLGSDQLLETKELFEQLWTIGLRMDEDHLDYLKKIGLIGHSSKHGRGRKMGVTSLWSQQQRRFLLGLLIQWQFNRTHRINLCKLPVWMWLYWGEEADIALDQIKVVMKTWASDHITYSYKNARRGAREVVRMLADSYASGYKRETINNLTYISYHGEYPDVEELCDLLKSVMAPKAKRRNDGEQNEQAMDNLTRLINREYDEHIVEKVAFLISARAAIVKALAQGKDIPDILWHWGHTFLQSNREGILKNFSPLSVTEIIDQHLFTTTWDNTGISACYDLATVLGFGLFRFALIQSLFSLVDPNYVPRQDWQYEEELLKYRCHQPLSTFAPSSLLLPNGIVHIEHPLANPFSASYEDSKLAERGFANLLEHLVELPPDAWNQRWQGQLPKWNCLCCHCGRYNTLAGFD